MKYTKVMIALFTFCAVNFVVFGEEESTKATTETKNYESSNSKTKHFKENR